MSERNPCFANDTIFSSLVTQDTVGYRHSCMCIYICFIKQKSNFTDKVTTTGDAVKLPDGKLIKEEEREKGKISKHVYLMYMKACSYSLSLLVILFIICTQAMKMGTDFWLSAWSESSVAGDEILDDIDDTTDDVCILILLLLWFNGNDSFPNTNCSSFTCNIFIQFFVIFLLKNKKRHF